MARVKTGTAFCVNYLTHARTSVQTRQIQQLADGELDLKLFLSSGELREAELVLGEEHVELLSGAKLVGALALIERLVGQLLLADSGRELSVP